MTNTTSDSNTQYSVVSTGNPPSPHWPTLTVLSESRGPLLGNLCRLSSEHPEPLGSFYQNDPRVLGTDLDGDVSVQVYSVSQLPALVIVVKLAALQLKISLAPLSIASFLLQVALLWLQIPRNGTGHCNA